MTGLVSWHQHCNRGNRLGSVDLYFDPEGQDRVADILVREGFYVGYETVPNEAPVETTLARSSKDQSASSSDNHHSLVSVGSSSSSEEATGSAQTFSPWQRMQQTLKLISDSPK